MKTYMVIFFTFMLIVAMCVIKLKINEGFITFKGKYADINLDGYTFNETNVKCKNWGAGAVGSTSIPIKNADSIEKCAFACNENEECKGFYFNPVSNNCWLENGTCENIPSDQVHYKKSLVQPPIHKESINTPATSDDINVTTSVINQSGVQEKCITVKDLTKASNWVDHLFGTLKQTKCANKDDIDKAHQASKTDFISGMIKSYDNKRDESDIFYRSAINKAKPFLEQAFSGESDNNLAQNIEGNTNIVNGKNIVGYTLPNGMVIKKGSGSCPNGCKLMQYDNRLCQNEIYNGKSYRSCPWVKNGLNVEDCAECGAVLLPRNKYGYAKTKPGLFDNISVDMTLKNNTVKCNSVKCNSGDFFNIGKNFLRQLGQIKDFVIPDNITKDEYTSLGKFVHKYQSEKTLQSGINLTNFINAILLTSTMNTNRNSNMNTNRNSNMNINRNSNMNNFHNAAININEISEESSYSDKEAFKKTTNDNIENGTQSKDNKYKNTAYTTKYRPRDPRVGPTPYNSIWQMYK